MTDFTINIIRQVIHTEGDGSSCPGCEKRIQEARKSVDSGGIIIRRSIIECPIGCGRKK